MPEEVLFEIEHTQSRAEIADYLTRVADNLQAGEPVSLRAGGDAVTIDPPARPTFEVKVEREGPTDASGELSVEFEIEWDENGGDGGDLEIE